MCEGTTVAVCIGLWLEAARADVGSMIVIMLGVVFTVAVAVWAVWFGRWALTSSVGGGVSEEKNDRWREPGH